MPALTPFVESDTAPHQLEKTNLP